MGNELLLVLAHTPSVFLAVPALFLSGFFLALFFKRRGDHFGPLNDIFFAISLVLLILPAIGIYSLTRDDNGLFVDVVVWLGIAGMVIVAIVRTLLALGVISLPTSFLTGGLGILPILAWMVSLAVLSLAWAQLPAIIGWATGVPLVLSFVVTLAWSLKHKVVAWS